MPSATDWARSIGTTIINYLREEELATFRKFKVFAALENSGNIVMNQGGRGIDWQVRYRNQPVQGNNGETPRVFSRQNLWVDAQLPYRGYQVTDSIYKKEMLENRGQQALVNVAGKMAARLQESMEQHLAKEIYVDGNSAENSLRFHGLESFMGCTQTIDSGVIPGPTGGSGPTAGHMFGYPDDTYAGLSTRLGALAGSQISGSWPNGECDPAFDFYSPVIVNYTSTAFGAGGWANNCRLAIREALHQTKRNDTKEAEIDMVLVDRQMYIDFLNKMDANERIIVTRQNGLKSFGFTDVVELDGVEVTTEYGVPKGCGYGLSINNMELRCMEGSLMTAEGPFYNEDLQSYRYVVSVLANLKFRSPRNFFKLAALT